MTQFFEFCQNNSGGGFTFDASSGISHIVIVEADDTQDAVDRAESIGLYFNGCSTGQDCSCCGDRWYEPYGGGDEVPSHYNRPLVEFGSDEHKAEPNYWEVSAWMAPKEEAFVHLVDGRFFGFHLVNGQFVYRGDPSDLVEALPNAPKVIEA